MIRYARFVVDFDRAELATGRRSWHQLSSEEQLEIPIPVEWRRKITTFTPQVFNTFKRAILPTEGAQMAGLKGSKIRGKARKVCTPADAEQQLPAVSQSGRWTLQEEILLVKRWGRFMKQENLTLDEFVEMTYSKACKRLTPRGRSSSAAWRKIQSIVSFWSFISAFNANHQPGWFELSDEGQDSKMKWGELPNNFEAMDQEVFCAMEKAVLKQSQYVEDAQPVAALSPDAATRLNFSPMPLTTPSNLTELHSPEQDVPVGSNAELDRLLLEDDDASPEIIVTTPVTQEQVTAVEPCSNSALMPATCSLIEDRSIKEECVPGQQPIELEPVAMVSMEGVAQTLLSTMDAYKLQVHQAISHLQAALDEEFKRTSGCIRAMELGGLLVSTAGLPKLMLLLMKHQNDRVVSALHHAEEMCRQHGTEMRPLVQELAGSGPALRRNGISDLRGVIDVPAPGGAVPF
ncbi:unnamed protein product [Phytophthora lilii]|uniref:Unnamed protein product n=1 Tax=Phytophthora lilii TaxID=2077276 RepID=A0A9W6TKZ3_9STRA|nr:unnamed protein product [Phytophthora lilii]